MSIVQHIIQIKNGTIKHVNVNVNIIVTANKTCICENSNYLKSIADTWVIACDKIISVMNIVSTNMTNTIATVSLAIILLLIITIIC